MSEVVKLKVEGHVSVARVERAWYVLCTSAELAQRPLRRLLFGRPLVLFRSEDGSTGALLDRCPHRNVPLSEGRVRGDCIECPYHGWQLNRDGRCEKVPSLCSPLSDKRVLARFATREQDGLVWVYGEPNGNPESEPFALPPLEPGYNEVQRTVEAEASLHATLENALDVPHTAFLHQGLFRNEKAQRNRIRAVVTRDHSSVQVEYIGEPRPEGLVGRILSPSGGLVTHFDRFIMPSIAQVEYKIGNENHILVTAFGSPVDDFKTRLFAVVRFRIRLVPAFLVKWILTPIALKIFAQDAVILAKQTQQIEAFGGEHYTSTEIDLMGPQIWRLLRRAENNKTDEESDDFRREVELEV